MPITRTGLSKIMKKSYFILFTFLSPLIAKCQYRFSFKIANINSTAYFESNNQNFYLDNDPVTRTEYHSAYRINSENTMDWPDGVGKSFLTDIGRKFAMELGIEKQINKRISISTGLEIGARYFSVNTLGYHNGMYDNFEMPLVNRSYRNFSMPFSISYNQRLYKRFSIKPNAGFSINMPESFSQKLLNDEFVVLAFSPVYFMLSIGTEVNYTLKNGNAIALTATFNKGFSNIIKDYISDQRALKDSIFDTPNNNYLRIDHYYTNKVAVASNGSNFSLGIKYYFLPFGKSVIEKNKKTHIPSALDFNNRIINKASEIIVDTNYIKLCLWDDQRIDGDSVSLEYKDSIIFGNVRLDATKKCIWIRVEKNQPNYLIVHALNEGRVKPNTVSVVIHSKDKEHPISIKTDLVKSGNINIKFE
jgi:hypothetical protein